LRRLGRTDEARDAYRRARELTDNGAERRFLERRLTELAATTGSGYYLVSRGCGMCGSV
jgi:RNA polymerase sigma-70 factor, ECF subfamily